MASLVKSMPPGFRDYGSMVVARDRLREQGKISVQRVRRLDTGRGRMVLVLKEWSLSDREHAGVVVRG